MEDLYAFSIGKVAFEISRLYGGVSQAQLLRIAALPCAENLAAVMRHRLAVGLVSIPSTPPDWCRSVHSAPDFWAGFHNGACTAAAVRSAVIR